LFKLYTSLQKFYRWARVCNLLCGLLESNGRIIDGLEEEWSDGRVEKTA
jgi:hypothetical protein